MVSGRACTQFTRLCLFKLYCSNLFRRCKVLMFKKANAKGPHLAADTDIKERPLNLN